MQLKTRAQTLVNRTPPLIPFFLGPLFFGVNRERLLDEAWMSSFLLFLLLFLSWSAVKACAFAIIERKAAAKAEPSGKDKLLLLGLVLSALLTLALLGTLRFKFEYIVFIVVLALLGFGALQTSLLKKGITGLAQLIGLIYLTGIGALSMVMMLENPTWQPLLISLGVACSVLAAEILRDVVNRKDVYPFERNGTPESAKQSKRERATRPVPLLLCCAPLFVAALAYMHELPRPYLAVVLVLLPSTSLITKLKNTKDSVELDRSVGTMAAGISLLFIGIITLVSHLTI